MTRTRRRGPTCRRSARRGQAVPRAGVTRPPPAAPARPPDVPRVLPAAATVLQRAQGVQVAQGPRAAPAAPPRVLTTVQARVLTVQAAVRMALAVTAAPGVPLAPGRRAGPPVLPRTSRCRAGRSGPDPRRTARTTCRRPAPGTCASRASG